MRGTRNRSTLVALATVACAALIATVAASADDGGRKGDDHQGKNGQGDGRGEDLLRSAGRQPAGRIRPSTASLAAVRRGSSTAAACSWRRTAGIKIQIRRVGHPDCSRDVPGEHRPAGDDGERVALSARRMTPARPRPPARCRSPRTVTPASRRRYAAVDVPRTDRPDPPERGRHRVHRAPGLALVGHTTTAACP